MSFCSSVRRRREGLRGSTAERMALAGAEYVDPAISTIHGGEHGGMSNSDTNTPSECLPEAVATFAAVSTIRCRRTSEVQNNGSHHGRPCSVHCQRTDAVSVCCKSPTLPPPNMVRTANHIGENLCDRDALAVLGPGETRLVPSIYRGEGVREGGVIIVRVESPPCVKECQKDGAGFCVGGAGLISPRYRETGHAAQTNRTCEWIIYHV